MSASDTIEGWRLVKVPSGDVESDLIQGRVREAYNRYASKIEARMIDDDGSKIDEYPRGQRVRAEYTTDGGSTWTPRLSGFVQTPTDEEGVFSILVVGYNHLLRRQSVFETYSSVSASTVLQDVIESYTPVTWNAANVDLTNDVTIDREFRGERADEVIAYIVSRSADEDYWVDENIEFHLGPRSTERAEKDLTVGRWYEYDLPRPGVNAVNNVLVFYNSGGSRSLVIVEDRAKQQSLKNTLGAARGVTFEAVVNFPEIADEEEAAAKGRQIQAQRSQTLTGYVSTWGHYGTNAGDVTRLEIPEKSIDIDVRVASIEYDMWTRDTSIQVAEDTGDINDLLAGLTDDVIRLDVRDADPTATGTRYLELFESTGVTVKPTVTKWVTKNHETGSTLGFHTGVSRPSPDTIGHGSTFTLGFENDRDTKSLDGEVSGVALTTSYLNGARDAWQGEGPIDISHGEAGYGTVTPSQAASGTDNPIDRSTVAEEIRGTTQSVYRLYFPAGVAAQAASVGENITEVAMFDADTGGTAFGVASLEEGVRADDPFPYETVDVEIEVQINNDFDFDTGIVTEDGQEALRDLTLGVVGGDGPANRAYGTGSSSGLALAESNTALDNKQGTVAIDNFDDRSVGVSDVGARFDTSTGNGLDISELGDEDSSGTLLTRALFEAESKTASFAWDTNIPLYVRGLIGSGVSP